MEKERALKRGFISRFSSMNDNLVEEVSQYTKDDIWLLTAPTIYNYDLKLLNKDLEMPSTIPTSLDNA